MWAFSCKRQKLVKRRDTLAASSCAQKLELEAKETFRGGRLFSNGCERRGGELWVEERETLEVLLVDDCQHIWIGRSEDGRSGCEELVKVLTFPPTLMEKRHKRLLSRLEHMVTPT